MSPGHRAARNGGRAVAFAVAIWVLVVALGSGLVWAVISRAGEGVVSGSPPIVAASQPTGSVTLHPKPSSPSAKPTKSPRDKESKSPRVSTPTTSASPAPSSTPTSKPATSSPTPTKSSKPPKPSSGQRRTWSGKAGSLTVSCSGSRIRLVAAQPNVGFRVAEVENEEGQELKVKFEGTNEGGEVQVTAVCRGGTPRLTVEAEGR